MVADVEVADARRPEADPEVHDAACADPAGMDVRHDDHPELAVVRRDQCVARLPQFVFRTGELHHDDVGGGDRVLSLHADGHRVAHRVGLEDRPRRGDALVSQLPTERGEPGAVHPCSVPDELHTALRRGDAMDERSHAGQCARVTCRHEDVGPPRPLGRRLTSRVGVLRIGCDAAARAPDRISARETAVT